MEESRPVESEVKRGDWSAAGEIGDKRHVPPMLDAVIPYKYKNAQNHLVSHAIKVTVISAHLFIVNVTQHLFFLNNSMRKVMTLHMTLNHTKA